MPLQVATQSAYTSITSQLTWSLFFKAHFYQLAFQQSSTVPYPHAQPSAGMWTKHWLQNRLLKVLFFKVDVFWSNKNTPRILRQASNKQLKCFPPFDNPQVSFIFSVPKGKLSHFYGKVIFRPLAEICKNLISLR